MQLPLGQLFLCPVAGEKSAGKRPFVQTWKGLAGGGTVQGLQSGKNGEVSTVGGQKTAVKVNERTRRRMEEYQLWSVYQLWTNYE